jgi:hypothetical protein
MSRDDEKEGEKKRINERMDQKGQSRPERMRSLLGISATTGHGNECRAGETGLQVLVFRRHMSKVAIGEDVLQPARLVVFVSRLAFVGRLLVFEDVFTTIWKYSRQFELDVLWL